MPTDMPTDVQQYCVTIGNLGVKFKKYLQFKANPICVFAQVQFWTTELEKMQKRHEGQPKHVKQGSLSSSSSNSTVSSIASKYDVNQLKKEISQAKSRVRL